MSVKVSGNIVCLPSINKVLTKVTLIVLACVSITSLVIFGTGCRQDIRQTAIPDASGGTGILTGVVTDNEAYLSEGTTPQTYQGANIFIYESVASGSYKTSADALELPNYIVGKEITKISSGEDGEFQVELAPGIYYIRAFYDENSYSGDVLIEVKPGIVTTVYLKLIHGV